ncbi:MAG: glycosyltransferase family 9 protein [Acidobacteria bacterium]|jgi:heptosyltransferase-1|nr:glycosyltransferase family 9 protein [Acidobacteriota bacterium]
MNILIVRLGALGDIVHAVPAAAALRHAFPDARIDWLVESKHRPIVDLVTCIDRVVPLERPSVAGWLDVSRRMQEIQYDVAIDFQGLMKSAVLARASGAPRVIGFSIWHLREKAARPFYSEIHRDTPTERADHVVRQNLALLQNLDVDDMTIRFPLAEVHSDALAEVRTTLGGDRPFALINPGAAWPNKRWPPERFGEVAAFLREIRDLPSFVLWGPGEEGLAGAVVERSDGAARVAPATRIADLLALSRAAGLMISGDTGPLHLAAAVGTPTVSLFGPTDPQRNGPWSADDVAVSRYGSCGCHYERRCRKSTWCLETIDVAEVTAAVQQRFQR